MSERTQSKKQRPSAPEKGSRGYWFRLIGLIFFVPASILSAIATVIFSFIIMLITNDDGNASMVIGAILGITTGCYLGYRIAKSNHKILMNADDETYRKAFSHRNLADNDSSFRDNNDSGSSLDFSSYAYWAFGDGWKPDYD